jgi:HEAT repeat protein
VSDEPSRRPPARGAREPPGDAIDDSRRRALASPDARVRLGALDELAQAGRPLDEAEALAVVACLGIGVKALQRRATDALCLTGDAARPAVLASLRALLDAPDADRRWGASYALGRLGVVEPALVPALLDALASRDGDRRWAAATLLVTCGTLHAETVLPALLDALHGTIPELRKMALYVLRDLAPSHPAVPDALLVALRDDDSAVRLAGLSAVVRLAPPPAHACDEVLRLVRDDPDAGVRRAAVSALGHLGRGVTGAEAAITAASGSDDPGLRRAAEAARRRLAGVP